MDENVFKAQMQELEEIFSHPYTEPQIRLFWRDLRSFSDDDFTIACVELHRTCERFPSLARIRAACMEARYQSVRDENNGQRPPDTPASPEVVCARCGADNTHDRPDVPTIIKLGTPVADGKQRYGFCCGACNTVF